MEFWVTAINKSVACFDLTNPDGDEVIRSLDPTIPNGWNFKLLEDDNDLNADSNNNNNNNEVVVVVVPTTPNCCKFTKDDDCNDDNNNNDAVAI